MKSTAERIADLLYAKHAAGILVTDPSTVSRECQLVMLMQDILSELMVDVNKEGYERAVCYLRSCRQSLDKVNGTLQAASAIASAVNSINP